MPTEENPFDISAYRIDDQREYFERQRVFVEFTFSHEMVMNRVRELRGFGPQEWMTQAYDIVNRYTANTDWLRMLTRTFDQAQRGYDRAMADELITVAMILILFEDERVQGSQIMHAAGLTVETWRDLRTYSQTIRIVGTVAAVAGRNVTPPSTQAAALYIDARRRTEALSQEPKPAPAIEPSKGRRLKVNNQRRVVVPEEVSVSTQPTPDKPESKRNLKLRKRRT